MKHRSGLTVPMICLIVCFAITTAGTARAAFTLEDERKVGREFYEKMEKSNALYKEKRVQSYITELGNSILSHSNKAPFDFHFSVYKDSAINAFATPGGYVYVSRGLIAIAEDEAQLASVMAHEIAHVNARHIARIIEKSTKVNVAALAAILAGAFLGGGSDLAAGAMAFSLAAATTLNLKYSREHEEEADRLGLSYLISTGYDGQGSVEMLRLMRRYEYYSSTIPSYFKTHPGTDDRIHYLDGMLQTVYRKQQGKDNLSKRFDRIRIEMALSRPDAQANYAYFRDRVKKNPASLDDRLGLAVSLERTGRVAEALEIFHKILQEAPNDADILRETGIVYVKTGRTQAAIEPLRKALQLDRDDRETLLYLGRAYGTMENYEAAVDLYRRLENDPPQEADILYNMAMAYGRTGRTGDYHYFYGLFLKKNGRKDNALYHLEEARKLLGRDPEKSRRVQKAIDSLKKGQDNPDSPPSNSAKRWGASRRM
ncbi:MAG: M48 family metalloprotease [Syntrophaceae bacterium]|nr:M48 family metalloprotease [Syntrophaceae bacterium]